MSERCANQQAIAVDETSAGTTVSMLVGTRLCVRLRARPSAGYEWSLERSPGATLKAAGEPRFANAEPEHRGATVDQVFQFTAESTGSTSLSFAYGQPFEPDRPPDRRFQIDVRVINTPE